MKTYHIKLLNKELLVVELPRVCDYGFGRDLLWIYDRDRDKMHEFKGSYTLLGKSAEIKEEDVIELVETFDLSYYVNYNHPSRGAYTITATESLLSAIDGVIFWENPLSKPRWDEIAPLESWNDYQDAVDEWQAAESRTFDKSRTLIFVKN